MRFYNDAVSAILHRYTVGFPIRSLWRHLPYAAQAMTIKCLLTNGTRAKLFVVMHKGVPFQRMPIQKRFLGNGHLKVIEFLNLLPGNVSFLWIVEFEKSGWKFINLVRIMLICLQQKSTWIWTLWVFHQQLHIIPKVPPLAYCNLWNLNSLATPMVKKSTVRSQMVCEWDCIPKKGQDSHISETSTTTLAWIWKLEQILWITTSHLIFFFQLCTDQG